MRVVAHPRDAKDAQLKQSEAKWRMYWFVELESPEMNLWAQLD